MDILLVSITLAISAAISHALWNSRRNESTRVRRVIGLALYGAAGIMLAKLVQLAILLSPAAVNANSLLVRYADVAATVVVAIGISLLAISLLDMVTIGSQLWPKQDDAQKRHAKDGVETTDPRMEPETIPAILFRREAPLVDTKTSSDFLNKRFENLLGFTREEMLSDPHFMTWLMHPEDRQEYVAGDDRLAATESEAVFDHRFKHRNGSYRWIRTMMKRINDEKGAFKEIIGCGFDITDLKEAEQQLAIILSTDPCSLLPEDDAI